MKIISLHGLAVSLTNALNRHANKEGIELQKMVFGMEIILHNIPKLVIMLTAALILGILPQTLATWLPFAIIRRYAGGLHAKNSITCLAMTLFMFVFLPFVAQGVFINALTLILFFVAISIVLYMYAPADTAAQPIIGKAKRLARKKKAMVACGLILILTLMFQLEAFYVLVTIGVIYAVMAILPYTYKILGRRMNNYEDYE